jgi:hypothetical protein
MRIGAGCGENSFHQEVAMNRLLIATVFIAAIVNMAHAQLQHKPVETVILFGFNADDNTYSG